MDSNNRSYAPDADSSPPDLVDLDELREAVRVAIARMRAGKSARSLMMIGPRGSGKAVLLGRLHDEAGALGVHTIGITGSGDQSLPVQLVPQLQMVLLRLSELAQAKDLAERGLRALTGFAQGLKSAYGDIEPGVGPESEPGLADNGDLEHDLPDLLEAAGAAVKSAGSALVIFVDELQQLPEVQLSALIAALHRCAQRVLPVQLVGAGQPQLRGRLGDTKSYAERLFEFREIGPVGATRQPGLSPNRPVR